MMDQVLLNLVINARDAMPTGGPLAITTGIRQLTPAEARGIPESRPGRYACLSVSDSDWGTETILVAEDEAALRAVTCRILQRHGYTVIEALDGVDALKRWDEYRGSFDLLLTDIVMPEGINGRDLAQHLLKRKPDLKVVFTSGYASETAGRHVFLEPGQWFLSKPCTPIELLDTIRRCLDA